MPLVCSKELADALFSLDALHAHERTTGATAPFDYDQPYAAQDGDLMASTPVCDYDSSRLIFGAASIGSAEVVRYLAEKLLAAGRDPHAVNADGDTPLQVAAVYGQDSCIRALVDFKGDVNETDNHGQTPTNPASLNGHPTTVRTLAELCWRQMSHERR